MKLAISGQKTVSTPGTAVVLINANMVTTSILIKAMDSNSGNIFIGKSDVDSNAGFIEPGRAISMDVNNKDEPIYIDAEYAGDGVCFWAIR